MIYDGRAFTCFLFCVESVIFLHLLFPQFYKSYSTEFPMSWNSYVPVHYSFFHYSVPELQVLQSQCWLIQGDPKMAPFLYALASSNRPINLFLKLFDYHNQEKICNNTVTKDPTAPRVKCFKSNN